MDIDVVVDVNDVIANGSDLARVLLNCFDSMHYAGTKDGFKGMYALVKFRGNECFASSIDEWRASKEEVKIHRDLKAEASHRCCCADKEWCEKHSKEELYGKATDALYRSIEEKIFFKIDVC